MKKSIQIIAIALVLLSGNSVIGQNDTMYVNYKGDVTFAIPTSQIDSLTFYRPNPSSTGLEYVLCGGSEFVWNDVTNPTTGKTWMDRNLGASRVATSSLDSLAYGDLYQWGRGADGHQCRNSDTTHVLSDKDNPGHEEFIVLSQGLDWRNPKNDNLWQDANGLNNPCPSGYRLPTKTEWEEEVNTWASNDSSGAYGSVLKLPMAGLRNWNLGSIASGVTGEYWSSTSSYNLACSLLFYSSNYAQMSTTSRRASGFSVRCIRN